jgi:hypothetical protein
MTIGKSRYNKKYQYELIRFCSKCHHNIIGAFSKMLSYFRTVYKFETMISYANKRWSDGSLYSKNSFNYLGDSEPNYYYFKRNEMKLFSRHYFQKHLLKDKLNKFEEDLTETENMYLNGYRKIYDCGQKCFLIESKY